MVAQLVTVAGALWFSRVQRRHCLFVIRVSIVTRSLMWMLSCSLPSLEILFAATSWTSPPPPPVLNGFRHQNALQPQQQVITEPPPRLRRVREDDAGKVRPASACPVHESRCKKPAEIFAEAIIRFGHEASARTDAADLRTGAVPPVLITSCCACSSRCRSTCSSR